MRLRFGAGLALALLCGCLDQSPVSPGGDDRSIGITPATAFLEPGASLHLDASPGLLLGGTVRWESSDPAVATVDAEGAIVARQVGTTEIRASGARGTGRSTVTVLPPTARVRSWRIAREGLTDASLLGYYSADPQTSFAVGTGSTILRTLDGGLSWSRMAAPDSLDLISVWGTSATNVYAVGSGGMILHFDGTSWTRMQSPTDRILFEVWGLGPDDIYAVGYRTSVHYDGTSWRLLAGVETAELWAVWGSDRAHIFAAGQDGLIMRLEGAKWVRMDSPTSLLLLGLWGTGPENVFAVGIQGTVLRWDGAQWASMSVPTGENLFAVFGKSGGEVLAVGDNGAMVLFNGATWNLLPQTASGENLRAVHAAPQGSFGAAGWDGTILRRELDGNWRVGTTSPLLFDLTRLSGGGDVVFAVGAGGAVLRDAGSGWLPLPLASKRPLYGVTDDRGELVAVGEAGTILRYDGLGWQNESHLAQWLLRSIWMDGTGAGFIVGEQGIILRRDGVSSPWREMPPPVERFFRHVWGLGPDQVYVVGDSGTVMTWNGNRWKIMATPTDSLLRRVWGSGPRDLFAVGVGGTILRFDGVRWYPMESPTTKDLRTVWGTGPTEVYAAGEEGTLLQFDGARWTAMESPTRALLLSIHPKEAGAAAVPLVVGAAGIRLEGVR